MVLFSDRLQNKETYTLDAILAGPPFQFGSGSKEEIPLPCPDLNPLCLLYLPKYGLYSPVIFGGFESDLSVSCL